MKRVVERFLFPRLDGAIAIGVSPRTFDYLTQSGVLPTVRIGKKVLVPRDALEEFSKKGISVVPKRASEKEGAAVGM